MALQGFIRYNFSYQLMLRQGVELRQQSWTSSRDFTNWAKRPWLTFFYFNSVLLSSPTHNSSGILPSSPNIASVIWDNCKSDKASNLIRCIFLQRKSKKNKWRWRKIKHYRFIEELRCKIAVDKWSILMNCTQGTIPHQRSLQVACYITHMVRSL